MARISKQSLVYSVIQKLMLPICKWSGKHLSIVGSDLWIKMTTELVGWKKHPGAKLWHCSAQEPLAAPLFSGSRAQLGGWETPGGPVPHCPFSSAPHPCWGKAHTVLAKGSSQCPVEHRAKYSCTQSSKARLPVLLSLSVRCWGAQALNDHLKVYKMIIVYLSLIFRQT